MKIAYPAALLALGLAAAPLTASAAPASDAAYDACARALVETLATHYGKAMRLLETRYPDAAVALDDSTELIVQATSPGAHRKFLSLASCTVNSAGEVQSLKTLKIAQR
jgi:trans-aconitate methyltransferase